MDVRNIPEFSLKIEIEIEKAQADVATSAKAKSRMKKNTELCAVVRLLGYKKQNTGRTWAAKKEYTRKVNVNTHPEWGETSEMKKKAT